jgi:hypothetical protein
MAGAFRKFAVNIRTSGETIPNARNAYSVGRTPPRSPPKSIDSRHAMAPAARPQRDEISLAPGATSSRVPHLGHSTPNEYATTLEAVISVLQCGQMRTATVHLPIRTTNNKRNRARMERPMKGRSDSVCPVGQTLLSVPYNLAPPCADRQECLSYMNLAANKLSHYRKDGDQSGRSQHPGRGDTGTCREAGRRRVSRWLHLRQAPASAQFRRIGRGLECLE